MTINLTHTGNLPAVAMGHNWVLSATADFKAVASAGMAVGLEQDYLPAEDDRILAATSIIGGGESTSTSFSIDSLDPDGSYTFFCSFPGHSAVMNGSIPNPLSRLDGSVPLVRCAALRGAAGGLFVVDR